VSRVDIMKLIEVELCKARDMAGHPDNAVLRYLIDLAILEARAKQTSPGEQTDNLRQFSARNQSPDPHKV
jgi:hypothetical protein